MATATLNVGTINGDDDDGEPLSILKFYYNCSFFTFFVPFRVVWDKRKKRYILVTYIIQQVLCASYHLALCPNTLILLKYLISDFSSAIIQNRKGVDDTFVSAAISLICRLTIQVFYFQSIFAVWFKRQETLDIINVVVCKSVPGRLVGKIYKLFAMIGVVGFIAVNVLSYRTITHLQTAHRQVDANKSIAVIPPDFGVITSLPYLDYITSAFQFHTMTFILVSQLFMTVLACGFLGMAWDFQNDLVRIGWDTSQGIKLYLKLKQNIGLVSKAWQSRLVSFTISIISYYSGLPDILMGYINEEPVESIVTYFITNTAGWVIAAKFHGLIEKYFLTWAEVAMFKSIPKSMSKGSSVFIFAEQDILVIRASDALQMATHYDNQLKLMAVKNDMQVQPVALACQYFAVTNSFLCRMLGLVLTYGIIIFQTRSTK